MILKDQESVTELIRYKLQRELEVRLEVYQKELPNGDTILVISVQQIEGEFWIERFPVMSVDKKDILQDLSTLCSILQREGLRVNKC